MTLVSLGDKLTGTDNIDITVVCCLHLCRKQIANFS